MNIGTSLIFQATGAELQSWPDLPQSIVYKGETRTGAIVGAQLGGDALLVERVLDTVPPDGNPPVTGESVQFDGSKVVVTRTYGTPNLQPLKAEAKAQIDRQAEDARQRYITAGAGQALEYQEAAEEAVRYAATGGAGSYPMLQASVDAGEAPDLAAAAALITARENAWATIGATIRRLRLTAKRAVDAATTVALIRSASQVEWP
jgi:hypothetical protein